MTYRMLHHRGDTVWRRDRQYTLRDVLALARRDQREVRDGYRRNHVHNARKLIVVDMTAKERPDVVLVANQD